MKNLHRISTLFIAISSCILPTSQAYCSDAMMVVDTDKCLSSSKIGKEEMEFLQTLQSKFEKDIIEKEKDVKELSMKFTDEYLSSLSEEAEKELKAQYEQANYILAETKHQAFNMFNQAKQQIMDKLLKWASKASETISKKMNAKIVIQAEDTLYYDSSLDATDKVRDELDDMYVKDLEKKTTEE